MLERFFGNDGILCGAGWWIIILFFLFLAFQDSCVELDLCAWIPFLILLLIVCGTGDFFDGGCGC